jgi:cytosine/adenosine deaminase-related metal-dependent hydrolase
MIRYRAEYILPIVDDMMRDAWVAVDDGRIAAVGGGDAGGAVDLGRVAIMPALVNAHTHLELSYLHNRIPPAGQFIDWIRALMAARREFPDAADPVILDAAARALDAARAAGTGLFGDVSNTLVTVPMLRDSGLGARVFYEQLGFNVPNAGERIAAARARIDELGSGDVRISLAPLAP